MEIKIEQKAYEDLRKLVKKLKEVSDEYKEIKDETLLRLFATVFAMGKIREEKIKNKILKEIEEKRKLETVNKKKVEYFNPENPYYHLGIDRGLEIAKDIIKKWLSVE